MSKIRLLTFSSLYPNSEQPRHGIFVENRLRQLLYSGHFASKVIAPVPWFPFSHAVFRKYGTYAKVSKNEIRYAIDILHPRYPAIPKFGMVAAPFLMAIALFPVIKNILRDYPFDIIDAHYFYPDGVAAVLLGKVIKKPVVVTARGTDLNLISKYYLPGKMIQWASRNSAHVITVSSSLKFILVKMGIDNEKITVLPNGVDSKIFKIPECKDKLKDIIGFKGKNIISIGNLEKNKGHDIIIKAVSKINDINLTVIGNGSEEKYLKRISKEIGCEDRINIKGNMSQEELSKYYGSADVLVFASSMEGCPNVVLESLSCGTPVISTKVGNIDELRLVDDRLIIVKERSVDAFVDAINQFYSLNRKQKEKDSKSGIFSWTNTINGFLLICNKIIN